MSCNDRYDPTLPVAVLGNDVAIPHFVSLDKVADMSQVYSNIRGMENYCANQDLSIATVISTEISVQPESHASAISQSLPIADGLVAPIPEVNGPKQSTIHLTALHASQFLMVFWKVQTAGTLDARYVVVTSQK